MIAPEKSERTNTWAAYFAAIGLAPLIGAFAASGVCAQTETAPQDQKNPAVAADDKNVEIEIELGNRLERRLKDFGDRLLEDLGPAGEEIRKAWDRAIKRAGETLEAEGFSSEGLRDAIDDVREEIGAALEQGSPVDRQVRRALDRLRRELSQAGEESTRELRESMRRQFLGDVEEEEAEAEEDVKVRKKDKADRAKDHERKHGDDDHKDRAKDHERKHGEGDHQNREEIEAARKEVRELGRKLQEAVRRLRDLQRESVREGREMRGPRRGPGEGRRSGPDGPAAHEGPRPPASREEFGPRRRGPGGFPPRDGEFRRGPGRGPEDGPRPGHGPDGPPPRDHDRRFRELEEKIDRILKELNELKGSGKSEKSSQKTGAMMAV